MLPDECIRIAPPTPKPLQSVKGESPEVVPHWFAFQHLGSRSRPTQAVSPPDIPGQPVPSPPDIPGQPALSPPDIPGQPVLSPPDIPGRRPASSCAVRETSAANVASSPVTASFAEASAAIVRPSSTTSRRANSSLCGKRQGRRLGVQVVARVCQVQRSRGVQRSLSPRQLEPSAG